MTERELGHSGIKVAPIALGTWAVGGGPWWGATDDGESIAAIHADPEVRHLFAFDGYARLDTVN